MITKDPLGSPRVQNTKFGRSVELSWRKNQKHHVDRWTNEMMEGWTNSQFIGQTSNVVGSHEASIRWTPGIKIFTEKKCINYG